MATIVRIREPRGKPPIIEVVGAPLGHNIYIGPLVTIPEVEHGALVNLLGVDQSGSLPDQGWRFRDPGLSREAAQNAL